MTPQPVPAPKKRSLWVWALIATAGMCLFCSALGLVLTALGLAGDDDPKRTANSLEAQGSPGAAGGFTLVIPSDLAPDGTGRWKMQIEDGYVPLSLEVVHLAALPGLDRAAERLAEQWVGVIGRDWNGVSATPLVMRRFVSNGARAHFTGAQLTPKQSDQPFYVSLYLVEAGDRLEPIVFIQGYSDTKGIGHREMASTSWSTSHPKVEAVVSQLAGSPVGLPLMSDEEVIGNWQYSSTNTQQWVNTMSGATSMTANAYSVEYVFGDDHQYSYKFNGAAGRVGALNFASEGDTGTWKIEHDQLLLTASSGKVRKHLMVNANVIPDGRRTLLLMDEGRYTLAPMSAGLGDLFIEKR